MAYGDMWTKAEDEKVDELFAEGKTDAQIAHDLTVVFSLGSWMRTEAAVRTRCHRLGLYDKYGDRRQIRRRRVDN